MSKSVLLCISTLLESGNHYSKMFNLKDSLGRQLFEQMCAAIPSTLSLLFSRAPSCAQSNHARVRRVGRAIAILRLRPLD